MAWFAARGVTAGRVLSDIGSAYRSTIAPTPASSSASRPSGPHPYRPQTNGKIERFHRTMGRRMAFRRMLLSALVRRQETPG